MQAINQNPSTADLHLVNSGSDWDWMVFAVMLLSDLALIAWTYTVGVFSFQRLLLLTYL